MMVGRSSSPTSEKEEILQVGFCPEELSLSHHSNFLEPQRRERTLVSTAMEHVVHPEAPVNQLSHNGQDHCASAHPIVLVTSHTTHSDPSPILHSNLRFKAAVKGL